jgi:hypothetical protein
MPFGRARRCLGRRVWHLADRVQFAERAWCERGLTRSPPFPAERQLAGKVRERGSPRVRWSELLWVLAEPFGWTLAVR